MVTRFEALVAGIGRNGVNNLHIRDVDHGDNVEYDLLRQPSSQRALTAGGFRNSFIELDARLSQPVDTSLEFQTFGTDARYARFEETVARFPQHLEIHRSFGAQINYLAQLFHERRPNDRELTEAWRTMFASQIAAGQLPNNLPRGFGNAYRALGPALWADMIDPALNEATIANMRDIITQRPGRNIFVYGQSHTAEDGTLSAADLDTAFPGYNIAVVRNRSARGMDGRTQYETALRGEDRPEFIYIVDEQRIEDLRSREEQARLPLDTIIDSGTNAINPQIASTTGLTSTRVRQTQPSTSTSTDTATPNNLNLQNLPWQTIIGTLIGGWLASSLGRGSFWNIIFMGIGALFGGLLGTAVRNGNSENHQTGEPASASLAVSSPVATPEVASVALAQSGSPSLGFAAINSVNLGTSARDVNALDALNAKAPSYTTTPIASENQHPLH